MLLKTTFFMAAESGFEPEQNESESFVLPLHNSAMSTDLNIIADFFANVKTFFEKNCKNFNLTVVCFTLQIIIQKSNCNSI